MNKRVSLLSLLFFLMLISSVYATEEQENPNILDIPSQLGSALGIGTFAAGILCSVVLVFAFILPLEIMTRGKSQFSVLIVGVGLMSFCVAVSWLPIYVIILIILLIAGLFGGKLKGIFT